MVSFRSDLARSGRTATKLIAVFLLFVFASQHLPAAPTDKDQLLDTFLKSQKNVQTWSADFVQTRTLKSIAKPLTANGHVWFAAPNRFHWELGKPATTIAVRATDEMLIIYPKLKRVEKYPLNAKAAGQWKDMLALLEAGFPRDRAELERQFKISAINIKNDNAELVLEPKSSSARKMMPQFKIGFSTNDFFLISTEMQFADGSTMRNDFSNGKINETADSALFNPQLPTDYKVVEPMKK